MPMELEMAELRKLLGRKLIGFEISADFVELEFEGGRLIIEIIYDGSEAFLDFRVVP